MQVDQTTAQGAGSLCKGN